MMISSFGRNSLWPFATLCLLAVGSVGASDPEPVLDSMEQVLLVQDELLTDDLLAEIELVADEVKQPLVEATKDDVLVLHDDVLKNDILKDDVLNEHETLVVGDNVDFDIEFVEPDPLPILKEIDELNGLPLMRIKDDQEGCAYFGVSLDGTVGLHVNF